MMSTLIRSTGAQNDALSDASSSRDIIQGSGGMVVE